MPSSVPSFLSCAFSLFLYPYRLFSHTSSFPYMIQPDPTRPCNHLPRRIRSSFTGRARFPCLSATLCFRLSDRNGSPIPLPLSQLPAGKPPDPLFFMNLRRFIVRSAFMGFPDVGSPSGASPQTKEQIHPTHTHAGSVDRKMIQSTLGLSINHYTTGQRKIIERSF